MASSPHRIRRQQWLVSTDTTEHAFVLRKQFRERWEDTLLPVFDRAFGEISVENQILHIPRLEIKLKVGDNSELWENIPKELYEQLTRQLRLIVTNENEQFADSVSMSETPVQQHKFELLINYLKQGSFAWQVSPLSAAELVEEQRETIKKYWQQLLKYIFSNSLPEPFFFRLFQLLSAEKSIELVSDLSVNFLSSPVDDLKTLLVSLLNSGDTYFNQYTRLSLASMFLFSGLTKERQNLFPDLISEVARILPFEKMIDFQYFVSYFPNHKLLFYPEGETQSLGVGVTEGIAAPSPGVNVSEGSEQQSPDLLSFDGKAARSPGAQAAEKDGQQLFGFLPVEDISGQSPDVRVFEGGEQQSLDFISFDDVEVQSPGVRLVEEKSELLNEYSVFEKPLDVVHSFPVNNIQNTPRLKVQNAGIVLLHPFLLRFFRQTGILTDQEKDISFFKLPRAAALLHFLATGSSEVYEFELGFIKLLLGMYPEQSLPVSDSLLTQQDKDEAEVLLQSVISHWTILKNTSIDGLRNSFLQRNALLHQTDEGWMVQMETTPFDMLINHLPWSFTIIKLPWIKKPIYTEWQTL